MKTLIRVLPLFLTVLGSILVGSAAGGVGALADHGTNVVQEYCVQYSVTARQLAKCNEHFARAELARPRPFTGHLALRPPPGWASQHPVYCSMRARAHRS